MTVKDFPGIHLPGSMPFADGEQMFRFVGQRLKPWVKRVPDETGARTGWVGTQRAAFDHEAFETSAPEPVGPLPPLPRRQLRDDVDRDAFEFAPFQYERAVAPSYEQFRRAREAGLLRADARLLVTMPTPHNVVSGFVATADQEPVRRAYERALARAVAHMATVVPADELAIQWDLVGELAILNDVFSVPYWDEATIRDSLATCAAMVPDGVELGYHLCYGDSNNAFLIRARAQGERHFARPPIPDSSALLRAATAVSDVVARRIDFVHMACPYQWTHAEHWRPLAKLALPAGTELFLGLVHAQDGIDGARERVELAAQVITDRAFGVATECGMGRYQDDAKFAAAIDALITLAGERSAV
jgi:hypothetical protein